MKFGDIVALAKQGYTPADIKELMSLSDETKDDTPDEEEQKTDLKDDQQDNSEDEKPEDPKDDDVDYKAMFEAEQKKNATLQKMVLHADMSRSDNKESDYDIFASVMRDFM